MKILPNGSRVFYYSAALRIRYAVCGLLCVAAPLYILFAVVFPQTVSRAKYAPFCAAALLCALLCWTGIRWIRTGLKGILLVVHPDSIQTANARYFAQDIEFVADLQDGDAAFGVSQEAFARQSATEKLTHRYGFLCTAALILAFAASVFFGLVSGNKPALRKILFAFFLGLFFLRAGIFQYKNCCTYIIRPAKTDRTVLNKELAAFCAVHGIVFTRE